ncbi:MAG: M15 family metallopeptidase [Proteobacteria bacterium]|nr:M15 family metallopeptidase [Pseudomonadota bacterium]
MRNLLFSLLCLVFLQLLNHGVYGQESAEVRKADAVQSSQQVIPEKAQRILQAYPDLHLQYRDNRILFEDGTAIVFDDGRTKDFASLLDESDIEDMFSMVYPSEGEPEYLQDAGRSRCEAFFRKMYGHDARRVKKNLVTVLWFGEKLKFSRINGAAEHLKAVADEIAKDHPELISYMKSAGTFYWRKVRGANRLSSHSYGIAIDIAVKQSNYWRWDYSKASETDTIGYQNRIPMEIVDIFEKHGFVWGGRWYHYDTMHFEYRPEISRIPL